MFLLSSWLPDAAPNLPAEAGAKLVRFIAVQDLSWAAKRSGSAPPRAKAVTKFLEKEGEPAFEAMVSLCHVAKKISDTEEEPSARAAAGRALIMAMGCLNTLQACREEGGARKLFAKLETEPKGQLASRLERYDFAREAIVDHPELQPAAGAAANEARASKPVEPVPSEEDETDVGCMPMPPRPAWKPLEPEPKGRWKRILQTVAKMVLVHLAFVMVGLAGREVYQQLSMVSGEL